MTTKRTARSPAPRLNPFDVLVDAANEDTAARVAERATHEAQSEAEHPHVAEVKHGLEEARHLCFHEKVVNGVQEDVSGCGGRRAERSPRPPIVLVIQEEVGDDDGDANSHNRKDDEDEEHEAVHIVEFVVPKGGEDKVHLDKDGAEGEHTAQTDQHRRPRVPSLLRYQSGDRIDPTGYVCGSGEVAAQDSAEDAERKGDKEPDQHDGEDGCERDRSEGVVHQSHDVQQQHHREAKDGVEGARIEHRRDPCPAVAARVERSRDVSRNEGRDGVTHDEGDEDCAPPHVQRGGGGEEDHHEDHRGDLGAGPHEGAEEPQLRRRPEHVAMHLLPSGLVELLVKVVQLTRLSRVLGIVLAQGAHQDQ
eukprot:CAMPEP_0181189658 /NCGR_PEP_ID=MMETSP1096-20121128/11777_1 /TAXON_ID=156174 ORGANISM="Chrysochromulina ericina, Strain CCMP281" /NCGR_SAMPLE_ID=MMETSP1096 /ASSEMBLY_ACC=CAM_ASM_000453 /LENGTH=362 /DNA_ID=CAMNT_0023278821 /DNA_START=539 /DNA_END=1628 /DNA_ORIENTATION=-